VRSAHLRTRVALGAALLGVALAALAESWDPADVAEAEQLRAEEAARAAAYRARVARGDVRSARAPMPREAPQRPGDGSAGDTLRGAAEIADLIERLLRGEGAAPRRAPQRDERRESERREGGADAWWEEEERRMRGER
jgi:hypothetical protein